MYTYRDLAKLIDNLPEDKKDCQVQIFINGQNKLIDINAFDLYVNGNLALSSNYEETKE